ncbi:hypothetical protein LX16_1053 [Stackebrandtia albiflava]|uniref:Uncharacterized protein n=1 Tax=Stackebrandtia albiflava TaxID=406432 RepID=A0A562VBW8_9ACTN|nr:hypothetical protein [Stackebrandtia albiflava]TWJ15352.1 hypothetical protein LX16_1053 [Stackebrandtia albiflava]
MDDGLLRQWRSFAAARVARFDGRNARRGGVVHTVGVVVWRAGIRIPTAACHSAEPGGELATMEPTDSPVDCPRCLARDARAWSGTAVQPTLFGDGWAATAQPSPPAQTRVRQVRGPT